MLYTDGLIEGRTGKGTARLGTDGMIEMVEHHLREGLGGEDLLDATVTEVRRAQRRRTDRRRRGHPAGAPPADPLSDRRTGSTPEAVRPRQPGVRGPPAGS